MQTWAGPTQCSMTPVQGTDIILLAMLLQYSCTKHALACPAAWKNV